MRVVDSSLWIEYIVDGQLADHAEKCIEPLDTCMLPAMVQYELTKWLMRNFDDALSKPVLSLLTECQTIPMDAAIATEAARLAIEHKLHATDAIIYATAVLHDAKLYTSDAHFKNLPGVEYFEKPQS
jgi:predicted nucleic acid-binding protein